jgi:serine/threonine protein kinase
MILNKSKISQNEESYQKAKTIFNKKFQKIFSIENNFTILRKIGKGTYAEAFLALSKSSKNKIIIKSYNLKTFTKSYHVARFIVIYFKKYF